MSSRGVTGMKDGAYDVRGRALEFLKFANLSSFHSKIHI